MPASFKTRRSFLQLSALAAVAVTRRSATWSFLRLPHKGGTAAGLDDLPRAGDPDLKALAMRALDAAKSAGATYADVRLTVTRSRTFQPAPSSSAFIPMDRQQVAIGVRAHTRGAWGFAANTVWSPEVVSQLGTTAAQQAQRGVWSHVPPVQLADRPVPVGHWETPIKRDPLTVPTEETVALLQSIGAKIQQRDVAWDVCLNFQRQDRTFAATDGAYTTQVVYTSLGGVPHDPTPPSMLTVIVKDLTTGIIVKYPVPVITPTGGGYEVLEDAHLVDRAPEWVAKARELVKAKDFNQLGQYQVVFDAAAMGAIVNATFGTALEYDRAVGYEANAGGTSYLAPPRKVLGTACAPSTVTISADRTLPGGAATVRWDDDGVAPAATPLVERGVLVDYATSREFVAELAPWYQKRGVAARSNGCAASESAFTTTMIHTPNLVLQPGAKDTTLDDLISTVENGMVVYGGSVEMDVQQVGGRGTGHQVYLIKHGKIVAPVKNAVYAFRSHELWARLIELGGARTVGTNGIAMSKGQPDQSTVHSVRAVAASFDQVQVNNTMNV